MRSHTDAAFKEVTLAATVKGLDHSGRAVVDHRAIVSHQDNEGVVLDAQRLQVFHQFSDVDVEASNAFLEHPCRHCDLFRESSERRNLRPVRSVEWLLGLDVPFHER